MENICFQNQVFYIIILFVFYYKDNNSYSETQLQNIVIFNFIANFSIVSGL